MSHEKFFFTVIALIICSAAGGFNMLFYAQEKTNAPGVPGPEIIILPQPRYESGTSLEAALLKRRSQREYSEQALFLEDVSQLVWAAQGITDKREGFRTAPSAGALYPLEVYVAAGNVKDVAPGVYQYRAPTHDLVKVKEGDVRRLLSRAALHQGCIEDGAIVIIISAVYQRTMKKYGNRGIRYAHIEVGHAAQNILLQAVSLNLGAVVVGAFDDDEVKKILSLPESEQPLYLMPVGKI